MEVPVLKVVREVERELAVAGVPTPRADAEILVAHALGASRSALYAAEAPIDPALVQPLVERRVRREPLAYILGEWGFRGLTLTVDRRVLVPRPETEVVVERCLALLCGLAEPRVLDVGTGSGAIALALAEEHPGARVIAVDTSAEALAVACENASRNGLAGRIELVHGDLLAGLRGPFDLVVSNPPYIRSDEIGALEPEVRDHEPRGALVAPGVTEAVAREARKVLRPGSRLVLECGDGQATNLVALLHSLRYEDVAVTPDLTGTDRVVDARR